MSDHIEDEKSKHERCIVAHIVTAQERSIS